MSSGGSNVTSVKLADGREAVLSVTSDSYVEDAIGGPGRAVYYDAYFVKGNGERDEDIAYVFGTRPRNVETYGDDWDYDTALARFNRAVEKANDKFAKNWAEVRAHPRRGTKGVRYHHRRKKGREGLGRG